MARVVYQHTVAAFIERVFVRRGALTPQVEAGLLALGVDARKPTEVPVMAWREVLRFAAHARHATLSEPDAMRELGREMIAGFEDSLVGKSMFLGLRLVGPKRAMLALAQNYRRVDNATRVAAQVLSEQRIALSFEVNEGIPFPTYTEGVLGEGAKLMGFPMDVEVQVESPTRVTYIVSW